MTLRGLRSMVWRGEQFRDSVRDERLFACWVLSMYSLRRSELLGLRWSDIDPDAGVLHVRQGRVAVAGGGSVVDDPQSHRSRRALPLPAEVAEALRSLKARQKKEAFALGVPWSDDRFVAVSEDGEPGRLEWFSRSVPPAAQAGRIAPYQAARPAQHFCVAHPRPGQAGPRRRGLARPRPAVSLSIYADAKADELRAAGASLFG